MIRILFPELLDRLNIMCIVKTVRILVFYVYGEKYACMSLPIQKIKLEPSRNGGNEKSAGLISMIVESTPYLNIEIPLYIIYKETLSSVYGILCMTVLHHRCTSPCGKHAHMHTRAHTRRHKKRKPT
jgi:hypothetical protein